MLPKEGPRPVGKPKLIGVSPAEGASREELLSTAAAVEALSGHPLAQAVVTGAKELGITPEAGAAVLAAHLRGDRDGTRKLADPDHYPRQIRAAHRF